MRKLTLLFSCTMIGSGLGVARPVRPFSQPNPTSSDQPFSRANIVLVHTTTPADSVFDGLVLYLQQTGFALDTVDRAHGLVTTRVELESPYRQGETKIRAIRVGTGSDWKLTGTYVIAAYGSGVAYPAEFRGTEIMPAKIHFRMVEKAAQSIPRATLRYARGTVRFGVMTKLDVALKSTW